MNSSRRCGCKGCRTCLICEKECGIQPRDLELPKDISYVFCPFCNKAWPGWNFEDYKKHPKHLGESIEFPGVFIQLDFLTSEEEKALMKEIDNMQWDLSQSGRRKQNFGPKCNFKKNKLKEGNFNGFPTFSKFVQDKFRNIAILKNFRTIEQCSLEYDPNRGASIDPHIDDCWIWGERIVTVNLLSDSTLTMTYNKKSHYYNLHQVLDYPSVLNTQGEFNVEGAPYVVKPYKEGTIYPIVRLPMPSKSLLVLYNSARYDWEHQILRQDIRERRVCLAYREFTPTYLPKGSKFSESERILEKALSFQNYINGDSIS